MEEVLSKEGNSTIEPQFKSPTFKIYLSESVSGKSMAYKSKNIT